MIKAIFFDIDGTLVSFKTHKVPQSTIDALNLLRKKGIKIFIATGRHPSIIGLGNNINELKFDGYVTLNGQYCFTDNKVIYKKSICREDIVKLIEFLKTSNYPCAFIEEKEYMYINHINDDVKAVLKSVNVPLPNVKDISRALENEIFQLNPYIPPEKDHIFMNILKNCDLTRWNPLFSDIIPAGGGKHVAIEKVREFYGFSKEETMAFGDGENDITMLSNVGIGVAMGNANEAVKKVANYITTSVDEDGIYNALKQFSII